jgi:Tfp pilus assembly protein PilF
VTRGFRALAAKNLTGAEAAFKEALALEPKEIGAMLGLAEVSLQRKLPLEAEGHLKRALAARPDSAEVLTAYGRYHLSLGRYAEAEVAYKKAIALDRRVVQAHLDLGDLYLTIQRKPKAAVDAYRGATAAQPHYAPARLGLGMALLASGAKADAISELQEAARLDPENPTAWHTIGRIHASEKRFDQAVDAFSRALEVKPNFLPARIDRADVYAETLKNREAADDYERILA